MAKSWQKYLDENGGDAEKAGQAAQTDVAREEKTSIRARQFRQAYQPLVKELDLPAEPEGDDEVKAARTAAEEALTTFRELGEAYEANGALLDEYEGVLTDLGIPTQPEEGEKEEAFAARFDGRVQLLQNQEERLQVSIRDAALSELKLDPKKAGQVLGKATLEKGKVMVKGEDGKSAEVETWGVKAADGTFTTVEKLVTDAGWTMQELAPRDATATTTNTGTDTTGQVSGWLLGTGQGEVNSGGASGDVLGFLAPKADAGKIA